MASLYVHMYVHVHIYAIFMLWSCRMLLSSLFLKMESCCSSLVLFVYVRAFAHFTLDLGHDGFLISVDVVLVFVLSWYTYSFYYVYYVHHLSRHLNNAEIEF